MQRTFLMVKPDGVERRLVGEIISRFERRGFRLVGLKLLQPDKKLAEMHYAVHKGKPFYDELISFITSGPVVAMVWEGKDIIDLARSMMGKLKPSEAMPGTIRGDFTSSTQQNLIHGSDHEDTAASEIALWFRPEELLE